MNIFDQLVIPASANHVILIKYMLIISLLLFIPYISMLLGGMFISTYFHKKGKQEGNNLYTRFAKDVIEKLTISNSAKLALGVIPVLSVFFAYSQLLYTAKTISLAMLTLAIVLFIFSFVFIYKYRDTFFLERILSPLASTGSIGKYLLLAASYIFAGAMALASSPDKWANIGNVLQLIFSWQTMFNFLTLISIAGLLSGGAIIFFFFNWDGGLTDMSDEYKKFASKFAGNLALISGILFPLMILLSYVYLPYSALSPSLFYYMIIVLVISLILGSFIHSMVKTSNTGAAAAVFVMIFVLVTFNILKDQLAFANAIQTNIASITKIADQHEKESRQKVMQSTGINAEAIFTQKCSACHSFDQKLVGPAFNQTLPKYNGDAQKLADFIFNPQKIDPAFPPMPVQGLKKKEALAIAQWLINKSSKK